MQGGPDASDLPGEKSHQEDGGPGAKPGRHPESFWGHAHPHAKAQLWFLVSAEAIGSSQGLSTLRRRRLRQSHAGTPIQPTPSPLSTTVSAAGHLPDVL